MVEKFFLRISAALYHIAHKTETRNFKIFVVCIREYIWLSSVPCMLSPSSSARAAGCHSSGDLRVARACVCVQSVGLFLTSLFN